MTATLPVRFHPASFRHALRSAGWPALTRAPLTELQINVGRLCNQACQHCHVDAGPKRTEIMERGTMERILAWLDGAHLSSVDITGGAPELNPHFRWFVDRLVDRRIAVTSRCNLTVLLETGQADLAEWYARRRVRLVCSLPCYSRANVDRQRGQGVFDRSIVALQRLNEAGYGTPDLVLDLVYNPLGATLPPDQGTLERDYKARLAEDFGIRFNRLLALANLPINRFAHYLERSGQMADYRRLLEDSFNPGTVAGLMCRHLLSVDWLGGIYDCDFNQMLDLPAGGRARMLWDVDPDRLEGTGIATDRHCFACTAGAGSSCGGSLAA